MKRFLTLAVFLILTITTTVIWWKNGTMPANSKDTMAQIFVIEKGTGLKEIANKLEVQGLIKNRIVFFLYTRLGKFEGKIQAGNFRLNPSMSAYDIAQNLTHGTLDIWITIPEGNRATEISDILEKNIPTFNASWKDSLVVNEGYLFPDTYLIPRDAEISQVVTLMKNNFDNKYASLENQKTPRFSQNEIVTIASLVEREAKFDSDRPLVASVIVNRLNEGMALQIDATVQYILGYQPGEKSWWKRNLTFADLKLSSPYNTYLNPGLPPTPIANPGIAAIEATINPAKTNYLYYVSDSKGHLHFASTLEGHNQNVSKYIQ